MKPAHSIWPGLVAIAALAAAARPQGILYSVTGPPNGSIGKVTAAVGDVDSDGADDFAVSDATDGGSVDVHSGRTGALIRHVLPPVPDTGFGGAIGGKGDIDLDGTPDIIIGATGAALSGEVYIYSGATFALIRTHTSTVAGTLFGKVVAMLGDLNGDGASEYAITAWPPLGPLVPSFVEIRSGIDGQLLKTFGGVVVSNIGSAYVALNDVTGDGTPDFALAEPNPSSGGYTANGEARVYSGATLDLWTSVSGPSDFALMGLTMAHLGDVDGDGLDEFAASSGFFNGNNFVSGVVVGSAASGAILTAAWGDKHTIDPVVNRVSSTSDADGDGADDALFTDSNGNIVMIASASGERLFLVELPIAGVSNPQSLAGIEDVNGDGYPEFLAGDPSFSPPGGQATGTVWALTTRPLLATPGTLSASAPEVIDFTLSPGVAHAGAIYLMLASATPESGSCAGMDIGGAQVHIPFCFDPVMKASIEQVNTTLFQTTYGFLDSYTGQGSAKLDATGVLIPPSTVGLVIDFFFLTHLPGIGWDKFWEAEPVEIGP